MRLGGDKMFLRLVLVGLVVDFANSLSAQHVATLGIVYLVVYLLLRLHAYRFLNANRRRCVVEDDCVC